jgi:hypothetical protein
MRRRRAIRKVSPSGLVTTVATIALGSNIDGLLATSGNAVIKIGPLP